MRGAQLERPRVFHRGAPGIPGPLVLEAGRETASGFSRRPGRPGGGVHRGAPSAAGSAGSSSGSPAGSTACPPSVTRTTSGSDWTRMAADCR